MFFKCAYCDPTAKRGETPIKTIDTDKHLFIKDKNKKYYHQECFEAYLRTKKKMSEEDIISTVNERRRQQEEEVKELQEKDAFLNWIMNFYDGTLPSYFLKKIQNVRDGTYEGLNEAIAYSTLLDIYQYMANYLNKNAMKKQINKTTQRMNYDLAVVIGNYGDYKRFKAKQHANQVTKETVTKQTTVDEKVKKASQKEKKEEFDITDYMDDLLL